MDHPCRSSSRKATSRIQSECEFVLYEYLFGLDGGLDRVELFTAFLEIPLGEDGGPAIRVEYEGTNGV